MEVECPQTSRSFHYWQPAPRWDCPHGWQILATQPWAPTQKGTCHTDIIYTVETREGGGGGDPETMQERTMVLQQIWGIHAHADNRRPLTAQVYQC